MRVPAGVALTAEALDGAPGAWAKRTAVDLWRWTELPRGGPFLAIDEPALLAEELSAFFRPLRAARGEEVRQPG